MLNVQDERSPALPPAFSPPLLGLPVGRFLCLESQPHTALGVAAFMRHSVLSAVPSRAVRAASSYVQMTLCCVNRPRLPFIVDMWVVCTLGLLQMLLMTVCVQVFAWSYIFIPFGFMPGDEMDGLYSNCVKLY